MVESSLTLKTQASNDQKSIIALLDYHRSHTNFCQKQIIIRDQQLILNIFVNYEKIDMNGKQFKPEEDAQDIVEIVEGESSDFTSDEEDQDKA